MISLRRARADDAATVARLATELGYPTDADQAGWRLARLEADPRQRILVAELDGAAAAWLHVAENDSLESEPYGEIVGLVVDSRHRGSGLGAALVAAAIAWSAERGLRELRVRSNVVRERAHRFYERQGFRFVKAQKVFTQAIAPR